MWKEGVSLGVLPPKDPLEGIDVDIKIVCDKIKGDPPVAMQKGITSNKKIIRGQKPL